MSQSLHSKRIVITRDQYQSQNLIDKIEAHRGIPITFPTIKIVGTSDWEACDLVLDEIRNVDWIIFTSSNSVRFFMGRVKYTGIDHIDCSIAAVGIKTAKELEKYDINVSLVPEDFSAKGLLKAFKNVDIADKHILIPGSNLAKEQLPDGLADMGAHVKKCVVYNTVQNNSLDGSEMRAMIEDVAIDCLTFSVHLLLRFF